jgi:hypothetical protein
MVLSIVRENTKEHADLPNFGSVDLAQKSPNYFEAGKVGRDAIQRSDLHDGSQNRNQ